VQRDAERPRLRAAGYDTVIAAGGLPDRVIAARSAEADRVLLTKDRQLAATVSGIAPVVLLPGNGIDGRGRRPAKTVGERQKAR
jgi:uncharacterized protein with PIN domain